MMTLFEIMKILDLKYFLEMLDWTPALRGYTPIIFDNDSNDICDFVYN